MNTTPINQALMSLRLRAERYERAHIVSTFVDVGPLFTLLQSDDHQILYGRRGTGKTHAFEYLADSIQRKGDISILVDMRTIGSNGGIYADVNIPVGERATRLMVDTYLAIHEQILEYVLDCEAIDLSQVTPKLDRFAESATEISVTGDITLQNENHVDTRDENAATGSATLSSKPGIDISSTSSTASQRGSSMLRKAEGQETHRVHFGTIQRDLAQLAGTLSQKRLWILLDEWSEVPLDLQPYLADLIRRTILPSNFATVKIAAIEQRTNFRRDSENSGYIGIEVGADVTANVNLDDFMVFDNDQDRAKQFFAEFLFKHVNPILIDAGSEPFRTADDLLRAAFTQRNVFGEFVRAAEGVPRDAINILSHAAQQALTNSISIPVLRRAATKWYQQGKERAVRNDSARALLRWIIDEVIAHRRARAFLVRSDKKHPLIDYLFDSRILHVIKHSISGHDTPGVRYDAYSIDYGCYVDLMNTSQAPQGLFEAETEQSAGFIEVPANDYRSIRRAILDLSEF